MHFFEGKPQEHYAIKIFFFLLPFLYLFTIGVSGIDDTDNGFIRAYGWRMFSGEIIYRDFLYIRPPMTAFLHYLQLKLFGTDYSVLVERLRFFLSFSAISYLTANILFKKFIEAESTTRLKLGKYAFASLIFVAQIHHFPAMSWYTHEGILFGAIALHFLSSGSKNYHFFLVGVFSLCSFMTKQSFYFFPFFVLGYLVLKKDSYRYIFSYLIGCLAIIIPFFLFLYSYGITEEFFRQVTGQTKFKDFFKAAFLVYVEYRVLLVSLCLIILPFLLNKTKISKKIVGISILVGCTLIMCAFFYKHRGDSFIFPFGYPQVLFLVATITACYALLRNHKEKLLLFLLMQSLAWCASISWGYPSPILYLGPSLFIIYSHLFRYFELKEKGFIALFLTLLALSVIGNLKAYRSGYRADIKNDLGVLDRKYFGIKGTDQIFKKYSELYELAEKFPKFTVLTAFPDANFATETKSILGIDWASDIEIGKNHEKMVAQLEKSDGVVFAEKYSSTKTNSRLKTYIVNSWNKIFETEAFIVYSK